MPSSTNRPDLPAPYPLKAARALALHAQGLSTPLGAEPPSDRDNIYQRIVQLGCLQIDTLQMVQRSQYLALWSRFGRYNPPDLDRLAYDPQERRLFEYWKHAACFIPLEEYRFHLPTMRKLRQEPGAWDRRWLEQPGTPELVQQVLEHVRRNGPVRVGDFEYEGEARGAWWDWKPAKRALERLYDIGELMIVDRINFQRVYDLTDRVLPPWVDTSEPSLEERNEHRVEQAVRALGICEPLQAAEYAYLNRTTVFPIVERLLKGGVILPVETELHNGQVATLVVHRDHWQALEMAAEDELQARRTTFLSPFDSLFWARGRDEQLWGFRQVLEAYKPAANRIWGYFCLPILHGDRLVGRFDPKLERAEGRLRLKALYLEDGVEVSDDLIAGVAAALRNFLAFHQATDLTIELSQPEEFGSRLLEVL